jgi:hypothetical protein
VDPAPTFGQRPTYDDGQFSITTDDDPESVKQTIAFGKPAEKPAAPAADEGGDDDEEAEESAPPPPKKPNGEAEPDGTGEETEGSAAQQARNPDGTFRPGKKPYQKKAETRINQAIFQQREAERRAEAAEARARQLEEEYRQPSNRSNRRSNSRGGRPRDGFPVYAEYLQTHPDATLEDWLDARDGYREERRMQQFQAQRQQHEQHALGVQWQQRLKAARDADPDFESKIDLTVPVSAPMMDIIRSSPIGPQLMLYLSANPGEARQLAMMPPATVLWAMGNLHGRLSAASHSSGSAPVVAKPSQANQFSRWRDRQ